MTYSTSNTYTLKREILTFSNKISRHLSKPDIKFTADMTYGMLASGSYLLTDIVDQLHVLLKVLVPKYAVFRFFSDFIKKNIMYQTTVSNPGYPYTFVRTIKMIQS